MGLATTLQERLITLYYIDRERRARNKQKKIKTKRHSSEDGLGDIPWIEAVLLEKRFVPVALYKIGSELRN